MKGQQGPWPTSPTVERVLAQAPSSSRRLRRIGFSSTLDWRYAPITFAVSNLGHTLSWLLWRRLIRHGRCIATKRRRGVGALAARRLAPFTDPTSYAPVSRLHAVAARRIRGIATFAEGAIRIGEAGLAGPLTPIAGSLRAGCIENDDARDTEEPWKQSSYHCLLREVTIWSSRPRASSGNSVR